MNKKELVGLLHESLDMSKKTIDSAVDAVFEGIKDGLLKDGKAQFVGFGTFSLATRAARKGRNPATGEELDIPETTVVKFKPSKALKEAVAFIELDVEGSEE
jgi:DNA-binding protein HU-beta